MGLNRGYTVDIHRYEEMVDLEYNYPSNLINGFDTAKTLDFRDA